MNKKLLSWSEKLKPHVRIGVEKQVFENKTRRDKLFEEALGDLPEETVDDIVDKINDELSKENVNLSNENIRGMAAEVVGKCLKKSPCLKLDLSCNFLRDVDISKLSANLHHKTSVLEDLNLSNNRIGIQGAKVLAQVLVYNKSLRSLNLDTNGITGSGIEMLAQSLSKNNSLQSFSANWNKLDIYAEDFYFTLSKNSTLLTLQLGYCNLKDEVAEALADGLMKNKSLLELFLFGNEITDRGATRLAQSLLTNRTLKYLNCSNNLLTDSSARLFLELIEMKSSENMELVVNLSQNDISNEMKNKLKLVRKRQERRPTKLMCLVDIPDNASFTSTRHDTASMFINNRFYEIKTLEDDDDGSSFFGSSSEEGSVLLE